MSDQLFGSTIFRHGMPHLGGRVTLARPRVAGRPTHAMPGLPFLWHGKKWLVCHVRVVGRESRGKLATCSMTKKLFVRRRSTYPTYPWHAELPDPTHPCHANFLVLPNMVGLPCLDGWHATSDFASTVELPLPCPTFGSVIFTVWHATSGWYGGG